MREFEMFRKPKGRNIRQRQREENTEDEEKSPVKPAEKAQNDVKSEDDDDFPKANAKKPVQLFSFDQDEGNDTEEFKVKKPSQKKRAERLMKKAKEYEKRQKELEAASKNEAVKDLELIVRNPITIRSRSEESDVEVLEDDEVVIEAVHHDMEVKSSFGTVEGIPDAKTVYEMKKKREQMRRDGGKINDDSSFIPLSTEKVVRSRLVREDDNDLSDEDGENVSEFYSSKSLLVTEEERRKREQEEFLRIEGDSEEEEEESDTEAKRKAKESDEEFAEWEKHQIQKAVSSRKVRQIQRETLAVTNEQQITPETVDLADLEEDMDIEVIETLPVIKNLPDVSQMKLADITGKIKLRIDDKQNYIAAQEYDLQRKQQTADDNLKCIVGIEADYPTLREKFRLFQEMRLYVKDLLDCINEKLDTVAEVENKIMLMWKTRSERLMKRRRMDVTDQYNKCLALAKGKTWYPDNETSQRETQREARRSYRRIQREKAGIQENHDDGLSSDEDEPESQQFEYRKTVAECLETAAHTFYDAAEEFSDVGLIMSRFAHWIFVDQQSFDDAYVALCLPKILSPFIRLELLDWHPLKDVSKPIFFFDWYKRLLTAGTDLVGFDLENATVVNLIPSIIDKLFLPRLTKIVNEQWDPFSLTQSRNLAYMINHLVNEAPSLTPDSKNVKTLLKAVLNKLDKSVNDDSDVPIFGQDALQNSSTGCSTFVNRRFWSMIKLVRSANCFKQILSTKALRGIILDGFINRSLVMMLHFMKDSPKTVDKCIAIIDEIPVVWLTTDDSAVFNSLITAFKRVLDSNPASKQTKRIQKFIATVEN